MATKRRRKTAAEQLLALREELRSVRDIVVALRAEVAAYAVALAARPYVAPATAPAAPAVPQMPFFPSTQPVIVPATEPAPFFDPWDHKIVCVGTGGTRHPVRAPDAPTVTFPGMTMHTSTETTNHDPHC